MRCRACERYMHGHHKRVIEHEDGSADVCDCPRCSLPEQIQQAVVLEAQDREDVRVIVRPFEDENTPPPHPLPFDHGKWRIAEERPGVDLNHPWLRGVCEECKEVTFSHDPRGVQNRELLCETCAYMILTELSEMRVQKENRRPAAVNIFEP